MERNFWTEENKIINYDKLMRMDIQKRLQRMSNQCVYGRDLADACYNYDVAIHNYSKAISFISDYAEEFIKSLERYKRDNGFMFPHVKNPTMVVNLMMLYKAKDIFDESELVNDNIDDRIVLNTNILSMLYEQLRVAEIGDDALCNKVFITKEDITQVCVDHVLNNIDAIKGLSLSQIAEKLPVMDISERTAKSLLKNSYSVIADTLFNNNSISLSGLEKMLSDVIAFQTIEVLKEDFGVSDTNVLADRQIEKLHIIADMYKMETGVEFAPVSMHEEELEEINGQERESGDRDNRQLR